MVIYGIFSRCCCWFYWCCWCFYCRCFYAASVVSFILRARIVTWGKSELDWCENTKDLCFSSGNVVNENGFCFEVWFLVALFLCEKFRGFSVMWISWLYGAIFLHTVAADTVALCWTHTASLEFEVWLWDYKWEVIFVFHSNDQRTICKYQNW